MGNMLYQATGESFEDLGQAVLMSKEGKEGEGLPGRDSWWMFIGQKISLDLL